MSPRMMTFSQVVEQERRIGIRCFGLWGKHLMLTNRRNAKPVICMHSQCKVDLTGWEEYYTIE
jgi:hypothetical protein